MLLNDVVFSLSSLFATGVWVLQVIFVKVCYITSQDRGIDDLFGSTVIMLIAYAKKKISILTFMRFSGKGRQLLITQLPMLISYVKLDHT